MPDRTYNPMYGQEEHRFEASPGAISADRPRIRFTSREVLHLAAGVVILTAAFSFVLKEMLERRTLSIQERLQLDPVIVIASFAAVASGFVLHELAHKIVAQRYGHWAEFRAHAAGLLIALALALFTGILFAAPGAVMIYGRVTLRENGLISLVGPAVNFVIAAIALPFTWQTNAEATLPTIMMVVALVNSLLAVFNLLPVGPLDGKKVWRWNRPIYLAALALSVAMFLVVFFGVVAP